MRKSERSPCLTCDQTGSRLECSETCKRLKEFQKGLPLVVESGSNWPSQKQMAIGPDGEGRRVEPRKGLDAEPEG